MKHGLTRVSKLAAVLLTLTAVMAGAGMNRSGLFLEVSYAEEPQLSASSEEDAFSIFGFPVSAAQGLSGYAYESIEPEIRKVYDQLYTGVSELKSSFTLRAPDAESIKAALAALIIDHPEFFWIDGNASMSGFAAFGIWHISLEFNVDPAEIPAIKKKIEDTAAMYLGSLPEDASDYQKVRTAYEFIINITDYSADSPQNQNIQSVFLNGLSVCAGYARALQYLLQQAGVWCAYIEGYTGEQQISHAWNMVRIDGVYTYVDPSWGDPTYAEDATDAARLSIIYDYLCLTHDEILRARHVPTAAYPLPDCSDRSYDYYRLNGLFYDSFDRDVISAALWHAVDEGERVVFMKFGDYESYAEAKNALFPSDGSEEDSLLTAPIRQRMEWDETSEMRYYYSCSEELYIIKVYW